MFRLFTYSGGKSECIGVMFHVKGRGANLSLKLARVVPSGDFACGMCQSTVHAPNDIRGSEPFSRNSERKSLANSHSEMIKYFLLLNTSENI